MELYDNFLFDKLEFLEVFCLKRIKKIFIRSLIKQKSSLNKFRLLLIIMTLLTIIILKHL